jgi:glycosyltransferase involved in cell wall biosynthesis
MLCLSHRVEFLGYVPREKLFELFARAAAVVFTGLREEGGMALAEAMLSGAPVIVLANGGARTVAESTTDPDRVALIEPAGTQETARRLAEAMFRFSRNPSASTGPTLDPDAARRTLRGIFEKALASSR